MKKIVTWKISLMFLFPEIRDKARVMDPALDCGGLS